MTRATNVRPLLLAVGALALAACGGGDDDTGSTTIPTTDPVPVVPTPEPTTPTPQTTEAPATTDAPATSVELVTEGATVVVANASSVNGAAGRLTERLAAAGFTTIEATNSSEGPLQTTKVYFNASVDGAQAVAESLAAAFGGGDITAEPLPTPAPLSDPEAIGEATVLVALGEDIVDKSLEELAGGGAADDDGDETDDTTGDSTGDTTEESTPTSGG